MQEVHGASQVSDSKKARRRSRSRDAPYSRKGKTTAAQLSQQSAPVDPKEPSTSSAKHRVRSRGRSGADTSKSGPKTEVQGHRQNSQQHVSQVQPEPPSDPLPAGQQQMEENKGRRRHRRRSGRALREAQPSSMSGQLDQSASSSPNQHTETQLAFRPSTLPSEVPQSTAGSQRRAPRSDQPSASAGLKVGKPLQEAESPAFIPLTAPPGIGRKSGNEETALKEPKFKSATEEVAVQGQAKSKARARSRRSEDVAGAFL